jgi:phosphoglucosamine mutase
MGLFGTSGIRKLANQSLFKIAFETGLALGQSHKDIIIGRDTRTSGNALKYALLSGLLSAGARCFDAGIVPTPTLAMAVGKSYIGVMITASHNPPEYNGIKIFNPDGSSFDVEQQAELEKVIGNSPTSASWDKIQTDSLPYPEAIENHISHIMKYIPSSPKTKVVVDCSCGAASVITPILLRRLGFDVITLNSHPSGFFPHDIEPIESNLGDLINVCLHLKAIGIAHDGDADRMMAVDEKGRFISGDRLLVILATQLKAREIVTTVDASMVVEELGFRTSRTKVGDTYVSEALRRGGDFGGEPSGAWIFPESSLCPDGIYAAAALAALASKDKLSSIVDGIPEYPIIRGSEPSNNIELPQIIEALSSLKSSRIDLSDGCKIMFEDGWILCRPSGTEPKIRITAEAKNRERARELYDNAVKLIKSTHRARDK